MEPPARPARVSGRQADAAEPSLHQPGTPYAAALQRYLDGVRVRDFDVALSAINDAVALEPGLVEPLRNRAILWQFMGDYVRAAFDWAACAAINPHVRDAVEIRTAVQQVRSASQQDPVLGQDLRQDDHRHPRLRAALELRVAEIRRRRMLLARPGCDLPCPSTCCHFDDETYTYGIMLTDEDLDKVESLMRETGRDEADFIAAVGDDGQHRLHFPLRAEGRIEPLAADWHPRNGAYRDLSWVTSQSRPCMFVGPTGCAVHEIGDPPGIAACRTFLCLTAFVCLVLRDVGALRTEDMAGRSIVELQDFAIAALQPLAACFASAPMVAAQHEMRQALVAAGRLAESDGDASVDGALETSRTRPKAGRSTPRATRDARSTPWLPHSSRGDSHDGSDQGVGRRPHAPGLRARRDRARRRRRRVQGRPDCRPPRRNPQRLRPRASSVGRIAGRRRNTVGLLPGLAAVEQALTDEQVLGRGRRRRRVRPLSQGARGHRQGRTSNRRLDSEPRLASRSLPASPLRSSPSSDHGNRGPPSPEASAVRRSLGGGGAGAPVSPGAARPLEPWL